VEALYAKANDKLLQEAAVRRLDLEAAGGGQARLTARSSQLVLSFALAYNASKRVVSFRVTGFSFQLFAQRVEFLRRNLLCSTTLTSNRFRSETSG